ncbi:hypothetical protein [Fluviispira sanaruensis]|uniref:Uncharacterized protein n=1 Tax=Fluviispira sanaruensis TaxID=2493639 RepID=A0A4P2VKI0_FLUSA|nr:hypothetical protein [Fluviispira sanaruensis]BBH53756.1 hypothetical protein JCM31447_22040 [Fluviispira sanaruensis]
MKFNIVIIFAILFLPKNSFCIEKMEIIANKVSVSAKNKPMNIDQAKEFYKVPAVSIALIDKNKID